MQGSGRAVTLGGTVLVLALALSCGGGDGGSAGDQVLGSSAFVPDRAPAEGEFFLVGGAVHDGKTDLELHVRWPAGKGSLAAVIMYLELPPGSALVDLRLAEGWPAWEGTPQLLPPRGPAAGNLWMFGLSGGIPNDDDGNRCIPFPEPVDGDLHLGTLTVRRGFISTGHVGLIPIEEFSDDPDLSGPNSWYCSEVGVGRFLFHTSTVGGTFR